MLGDQSADRSFQTLEPPQWREEPVCYCCSVQSGTEGG